MIGRKISYFPKQQEPNMFSASGLGVTIQGIQGKKPNGLHQGQSQFMYSYKTTNPSPGGLPASNPRFGPYKTGASPAVVTLNQHQDSLRGSKRATKIDQRRPMANPEWTLIDSKEDIMKSIFSTNTSTQYGGKGDPSKGIIVQNLSKKISEEYGGGGGGGASPITGSNSTAASTNNSYVIKNVSVNYNRTPLKNTIKPDGKPANFNLNVPSFAEGRLKASSDALVPAKSPVANKQSLTTLNSTNPTVSLRMKQARGRNNVGVSLPAPDPLKRAAPAAVHSSGSKPPRPIRKEQSLEKQSFKQSVIMMVKDTSAPELTPIAPTLPQIASPAVSKAQLPPIAVEPPKKKKKVPRSKKYLDSLATQLTDLSAETQDLLKLALETVPKVTAKSWVDFA